MGLLRRMTRAELERGGVEFDALLDDVAGGKSLQVVCDDLALSAYVVLGWIRDDAERSAAYDRALGVAAEMMMHQCLPLADGAEETKGALVKAGLQINTRMKLAAKWDRGRYGDGPAVSLGHTLNFNDANIEITFVRADGGRPGLKSEGVALIEQVPSEGTPA